MGKVRELKEQYRAIIKANQGKGYFEVQAGLNPDAFDDRNELNVVAFKGSQAGERFLQAATNFEPESFEDGEPNPAYAAYAEHLKIFLESYQGNPGKVQKHYADLAYKQHAAKRSENIKAAEETGKARAANFISVLLNVESDFNADVVKRFKGEFNSNVFEIEPAFINAEYKEYKLIRVPVKSEAYEATITKGYKPADKNEQAVLNNLAEFMKLKHEAVGYKGDKEVYELFLAETLPISGTPAFKPLK